MMKFTPKHYFNLSALAIMALAPMSRGQSVGTLTTLYGFTGGSDSSEPDGNLIQGSNGNFYGTTAGNSDNSDYGTVFEITPTGVFATLHTFTNGSDGAQPESGLVLGRDGNFYGTTTYGGTDGSGTVFQMTPAGVLTTLYAFTGGSDGGNPEAGLFQSSDGNFYGTTHGGGMYGADPSTFTTGYGTVFQLTPAGVLTTLHSFTGGSDGSYPSAGLIQGSDGNFYGTTVGDNVHNNGSIFEITPTGVLTVLYSFARSNDNFGPSASLVQGSDGNFYGTSFEVSSSPDGVVFQIAPTGVLTILHSFTGAGDGDGATPNGLIQGRDGNFYGTTYSGGTIADNGDSDGTIFQITPAGVLTTLHAFTGSDGEIPLAALVEGSDGSFYGTTSFGGPNSGGTIFKLTVGATSGHPAFFAGEVPLDNGTYYLAFPSGNPFGYYSFLTNPAYIYHFDLGYEYVFDANDGNSGVYLYDFTSSDFFYTSPTFPFPYLYDFGLQSTVYYYPDLNNAGHYNTDGVRYFYVFNTGQIISK